MNVRRSAPFLAFGAALALGVGLGPGAWLGDVVERWSLAAPDQGAVAGAPQNERDVADPRSALDVGAPVDPSTRLELRRWPPGTWAPVELGWLEGAEPRCEPERALSRPTGAPPSLACDQARAVVAQARASLATPAEPIDDGRFAQVTSDWLDPHGLWSVAPDSPLAALLRARSGALLTELEAPRGTGGCEVALELGAALSAWSSELRKIADESRRLAVQRPLPPARAWELFTSTPFEDGKVTRSARELARLLGHSAGVAEASFGDGVSASADAMLERTAPLAPPERWSEIVLAAAVRAYVPQIDPHGAWAPLDEETSIYDLDLEVDPPPRLWGDMTRTALGLRIDRGALPPLRAGDVVLSVAGVSVAGMSVEQLDQLSVLDEATDLGERAEVEVELLRAGTGAPLRLRVGPSPVPREPQGPTLPGGLESSEVGFGDGHVLVLRIPDVPDDLGDRVADALAEARDGAAPLGVLLDLRGNGGGSTDGALATLGLFLPGAALFPMRRRGGEIEVDRAPTPAPEQGWSGPVAALVDGDSASAAEMIAGALAAYRRGPVLGSRTYGKGCAQEYLDDDASRGVLRLTTLVFSLPDGSPLQRVGVMPQVALSVPGASGEREELLPRAPLSWRGPDVRDPSLVREVPWPSSGGRVGPASDPLLARALRAVGTTRAAAR